MVTRVAENRFPWGQQRPGPVVRERAPAYTNFWDLLIGRTQHESHVLHGGQIICEENFYRATWPGQKIVDTNADARFVSRG